MSFLPERWREAALRHDRWGTGERDLYTGCRSSCRARVASLARGRPSRGVTNCTRCWRPYLLRAFPVGQRVGNVRNNEPTLLDLLALAGCICPTAIRHPARSSITSCAGSRGSRRTPPTADAGRIGRRLQRDANGPRCVQARALGRRRSVPARSAGSLSWSPIVRQPEPSPKV